MDFALLLIDLALFCVTVLWVGKKPTFAKVTAMIFVIAVVELGIDSVLAWQQGLNVFEWYRQAFDSVMSAYGEVLGSAELESFDTVVNTVTGCLVAMYVIQAASQVFVALLLVWAVKRLRKRPLGWSPLSKVDLPVWVVLPLIVGFLGIALCNVSALPHKDEIFLVALNVLVIACIPLFAQGLAACKGVLNNANCSAIVQFLIAFVTGLFGVFALVVVAVGLIDFWANLRKLPRDGNTE